MSERQEIVRRLQAILPELRARYGIASLALFGSAARDQGRRDSDVDVLVSFAPGAGVTLMTLAAITSRLEDALARKVEVVEDHPRLRPSFRAGIQRDLYRVA